MPKSSLSLDADKEVYIYKNKQIYGKMQRGMLFLYKGGNKYIEDDGGLKSEILDILPEGIDLTIMMNAFNIKNPLELLPFLKNTIGDFDFSIIGDKTSFDKPILSNLTLENTFFNILSCNIDITPSHLKPSVNTPNGIQRLSLSGYQHKLQVSIIDNVIKEDYGDFILKPDSDRFKELALNEHLNMSFMREFGLEVPFNAIVYDEWFKCFHYLVKRFDIDSNGSKLPQISLNALMRSADKYDGTIEKVSSFLNSRLDKTQKMLFLEYIYANALLYNNDLHKKNISFVFKDNQLVLSPVYDVINVYAIMLTNKFDYIKRNQCFLPIGGYDDNIKISYFKQSAENLGLDFNQVGENLQKIQDIYIEKYPLYIAEMTKIPYVKIAREFEELLLRSYNKNIDVIKNITQGTNHKDFAGFEYENTSGMDLLRDEFAQTSQSANKQYAPTNSQYEHFRSVIWRDLEKNHNIKSEKIDNEKKISIETKIDEFLDKIFDLDKVDFMEQSNEFVNDLVREINSNKPTGQRL